MVRDPKSETALVLRMVSEDRSGQVRYYLPSPSVALLDGGFDYDVSLRRPDFAEAISRVIFFNDEADLRRKILLGPRDKWAVVYLSTMYAPDGIGPTTLRPPRGGTSAWTPRS
jgi:hypothetical protein